MIPLASLYLHFSSALILLREPESNQNLERTAAGPGKEKSQRRKGSVFYTPSDEHAIYRSLDQPSRVRGARSPRQNLFCWRYLAPAPSGI